MGDEVEFVYNTRLRRRSLSIDFYDRISSALLSDIRRENRDEEDDEEEDPYGGDDDRDVDYLPEEDASDIEQEEIIEPNEILDSDEEIENDLLHEPTATPEQSANEHSFYGRDGTEWKKDEPCAAIRTRQHNIMRFRSGPKHQNSVAIEVFKKFFTPNISFIVISETNRYAREAIQKWNEAHPDSKQRVWIDLTSTELDAFIGILLVMGVTHNNMQKAVVLWRSDSLPIFRSAMSYHRFRILTRYIRFDNSRTREFRQRTDKAAPIRDIRNILNENLKDNYDPHENITIDEQLFPYRGRRDCRLCLQGGDKVRRKTRFYCTACMNPVCQQHSKVSYTCFACLPPNP